LAPRIYYFDPILAGPHRSWSVHLSRCRELGFSHLLSAPLFDPGQSGDLFLSSDHERLNPGISPATGVDSFVTEFARACQDHDLNLLLDVVVGRVAIDSAIARLKPEWFRRDSTGTWVDPRDLRRHGNAALARFDEPTIGKQIAAWWIERLLRLARAGVAGFRLLRWRTLDSTLRFRRWHGGMVVPIGSLQSMNCCAALAQSSVLRKRRMRRASWAAYKVQPNIATCCAVLPRSVTAS
jgi:hypothetical protein